MPTLPIVRQRVTKLPDGPPLVIVLAGGTTGIGSYIADSIGWAWAKHGAKIRVYIVGRNAARAQDVIKRNSAVSPGSDWRFIQSKDLALIGEVDRCCNEIITSEKKSPFKDDHPRIDLLYMSHCYPIFKERTTTSEGLDAFISTVYYSRIRFITQLLPLLTASHLPAHVISIYAGGFEDGTKPGELPIGTPPAEIYGIGTVRKYTCFMKNFVFEKLAEEHAGQLRLSHIYPGLVDGPAFYGSDTPTWFNWVWRVMRPLLTWVYMTPSGDCGDVMLSLAAPEYTARHPNRKDLTGLPRSTDGLPGGGCYALGQRGDPPTKGISYERVRKDTTRDQIWEHTSQVLEGAVNGSLCQ